MGTRKSVKGRPMQLSIRHTLLLVSLVFAALIVSSAVFVTMLLEGDRQHLAIATLRDASLNLAFELKQSSDDLTRFARTYVVTGDPKYEHYFQTIIAIRDGKQAHPKEFTTAYWDLVTGGVVALDQDGEVYSIEQRMIDLGLTEEERAKLLEAKKESDDLINLEDIAMNAVKGLYKDDHGQFTIKGEPDRAMARRLVHGKAYHDAKGRIMKPIDQFLSLLEWRTGNELNLIHRRNHAITLGITALVAITIGFSIYVFFLLKRRIVLPLAVLKAGAQTLKKGDYSHQIDLAGKDEIGALAKVFNSMAHSIEEHTEELRKLSRAIKFSPASIIITDLEGTIEYVNPKFTEVTGYSAEEAIDQNPRILNSGRQSPEIYREMWEVVKSGRVWRGDFHNVKKNGELYWESASISPVRNAQGRITHFVSVSEDITARRQVAEELRRTKEEAVLANQAKSEFLANMSHEIRTPMNSILGFLELVLEDPSLTEVQRRNLTTAQTSANGLLGLINDILDISKLESGKLTIEQRSFSLSRLMREIHETMDIRAREKGLNLQLDIQPSVSGSFMGDPLRLRQIMINLVGNAIKFTEKGRVLMRIMPAEKEDQLHFMIEDTGVGIPADRLSQIFETFTQADTSTTRQFGGTGLGTTISRELVERMGGRIWAESEENKGSTFHFTVTMTSTDQVPEGVGQAVSEDAMDVSEPSRLEMPKKEMDVADLKALFIKMLAAFDQFSPHAIEPFLSELKEYLSQDQLIPIVNHMERFDFDGAKQETVKLAKILKIDVEG